jgi:hypothetical protein
MLVFGIIYVYIIGVYFFKNLFSVFLLNISHLKILCQQV